MVGMRFSKDSTVVRLPGPMATMKERLLKKFEDEIQALNYELKVELPKEILRARELGDLRENAEYHAAKERQRLVEARVGRPTGPVAEIQLINPAPIPENERRCGSTRPVAHANA